MPVLTVQMLRGVQLERGFSLDQLVRQTDGYSGSDMRELCRSAASVAVREVMRDKLKTAGPAALERAKVDGFAIRPLRASLRFGPAGLALTRAAGNSDFVHDHQGLASNSGSFKSSITGHIVAEDLD